LTPRSYRWVDGLNQVAQLAAEYQVTGSIVDGALVYQVEGGDQRIKRGKAESQVSNVVRFVFAVTKLKVTTRV
jgi:hypothetical protein